MEYRKLGTLEVSAIGLGCLGMSGGYGQATAAECVATIRHALDRGVTLLDTAAFYADGANESLVGQAIAGRRSEVVVATRGGLRAAAPGGPPKIVDGSPGHLRAACEESLRRLGVDHVDLYYLGRVDPAVAVQDSVGALAELVAEGKIRHIGLSEASADAIRQAHTVHPISALETEYSLWERHVEDEILPVTRQLGIGFVAHTPLGKGMLTGRLPAEFEAGDYRMNHPRFQGGNLSHNRELIAAVQAGMANTGLPAAQLALAWLLSRGPDIVPIPGTRRIPHLNANIDAVDIHLGEADAARLTELITAQQVAGARQPVRR
jgi:aryl-alcohol dehydrogenase-like predicted oxidoreductase